MSKTTFCMIYFTPLYTKNNLLAAIMCFIYCVQSTRNKRNYYDMIIVLQELTVYTTERHIWEKK